MSSNLLFFFLLILFFIALHLQGSHTLSTSSCNVEAVNKLREYEGIAKAIEKIKTNIKMVRKQIDLLSVSKVMKIGTIHAFELLGNDTSLTTQEEFAELYEKTKIEMMQILKHERELVVKERILKTSIAILENKDESLRASFLTKVGYSFQTKNCQCFDILTGLQCSSNPEFLKVTQKMIGSSLIYSLPDDSNYVPKSCKEYFLNYNNGTLESGVYLVKPSEINEAFTVYCDMREGWTYLNGIGTLKTPSVSPVPPILPSNVNTLQFQSVLLTATEVKSSMGDRCLIDIENTESNRHKDRVMNELCKGTLYFEEGISFIKYYAK